METARDCTFCDREALEVVLAETPHFLVLADYAPLVEGHILIVPREHLACYGALPQALEVEFLALKARVASFLRAAYAEPTFFEHGVFHQTVYHAHLHAFPFGAGKLDLPDTTMARPASRLDDVRAWYADHGHYFYVEPPTTAHGQPADAGDGSRIGLIFPPRESIYFPTLLALRQASSAATAWAPAPLRRLTGREKMARVAAAWHAFERSSPSEADEAAGQ